MGVVASPQSLWGGDREAGLSRGVWETGPDPTTAQGTRKDFPGDSAPLRLWFQGTPGDRLIRGWGGVCVRALEAGELQGYIQTPQPRAGPGGGGDSLR